MQHKWQHDKTGNGTYQPRDCTGVFVPKKSDPVAVGDEVQSKIAKQIAQLCANCERPEAGHIGIPTDDHSHCLLTCEQCGKVVSCNKLMPQDQVCEPLNN